MAQNLWLVFAILASVTWGLSYSFSEKLMRMGLSPTFVMTFTGIMYLLVCAGFTSFAGHIKQDIDVLLKGGTGLLFLLLFVGLTQAIGSLLIYHSIYLKNATLTSLVEITYPIFTALFAYIFFKEVQLSIWTGIGGFFIFFGVTMIYLKA